MGILIACAPLQCVKAIFHENGPSTSGGEDAKTQSCLGETQKVHFIAWKVVLHCTFQTATSTTVVRSSKAERLQRLKGSMFNPCWANNHTSKSQWRWYEGLVPSPYDPFGSNSLAFVLGYQEAVGFGGSTPCGVSPVFCASQHLPRCFPPRRSWTKGRVPSSQWPTPHNQR